MPAHRRQRPAAAKDWYWMVNNWTAVMGEEIWRYLDMYAAYWVFEAEGTRHLQEFMQLKNKDGIGTIEVKIALRNIHLEKRRGIAEEAAIHCKKDWEYGGFVQTAGMSAGLAMSVDNFQNQGNCNL